jgi:DNA end-binding protein Ku
MADKHSVWRGHLRLALVSCPVVLYSARRASAELHFHFINPKTNNRVRMITLDAGTDEELQRSQLVRGYEFEKDTYVILDDDDFERARIDSSTVLNVDKFVDAAAIDPIYYDSSFYLAPDGEVGRDVYAVLRDAIAATGRVALSRLVISRRERAVAVMPLGRGLVLHTLHDKTEIADPGGMFADLPDSKPDPEMIALARQLIDRQTAAFSPDDMDDRYAARLREVIEAKLQGRPGPQPAAVTERNNVIDLMAALKRSLGQTDSKPEAAAPKPAAAKPARVAAKAKSAAAPKREAAAPKPAPAKRKRA